MKFKNFKDWLNENATSTACVAHYPGIAISPFSLHQEKNKKTKKKKKESKEDDKD